MQRVILVCLVRCVKRTGTAGVRIAAHTLPLTYARALGIGGEIIFKVAIPQVPDLCHSPAQGFCFAAADFLPSQAPSASWPFDQWPLSWPCTTFAVAV